MREAVSLADFSYSSTGNAIAASPNIRVVKGSVTVTAVTLALSSLARSKPAATALPARSDPSVAMRICLYILTLVSLGHGGRLSLNLRPPQHFDASQGASYGRGQNLRVLGAGPIRARSRCTNPARPAVLTPI